jgi:hypothetical protein
VTARRCPARLFTALLLGALIVPDAIGQAQSARTLGSEGIEAFRALDFEGSVKSLRTLLAGRAATSLGDSVQAELLTYIGAAEFLLGRRTEAMRTFRTALEHAPEARPDTLVFPPAITTAFADARRGTALVVARPAGASAFVAGRGRIEFRLEASAPHVVRAAIQDHRGVVVRPLFDGPITDTLWLAWDGLVGTGGVATTGRATLCVTSIDSEGIARTLRLPLEVEWLDAPPPKVATVDRTVLSSTAGAPTSGGAAPAAVTQPKRRARLLTGALAAVAVVALPHAISTSPEPSSRRYVVSVALAATSLFAFHRDGRVPSPPEPGVRPPARLDPTAQPTEMSRPGPSAIAPRLRISPLATRARSER